MYLQVCLGETTGHFSGDDTVSQCHPNSFTVSFIVLSRRAKTELPVAVGLEDILKLIRCVRMLLYFGVLSTG